MGVKTHLSSYPAEALGGLTLGVTPLEMADRLRDARRRRLAQHADRDHQGRLPGRPRRPQLGRAPPGEGAQRRGHRRGDRASSQHNVESGTATRSAIDCPTAAKTGTTSELVDAWLDGYTPNYATVVWMGYPNKRVSMTDVHGEPQQGGYLPAEIWHDYMAAVTEGKPCVPFPQPKESISYQPFFGKLREHRRRPGGEASDGPAHTNSLGASDARPRSTARARARARAPTTPEARPERTCPTPASGAGP